MAIKPRPDQARRIQEALRSGLIKSAEEILDAGLEALRGRTERRAVHGKRPEGKKSLAQLFAESPLKGLDLEFERDPDTGREHL